MVFDKIKSLLQEQLNIDPRKVTMDSDIIADLGADSLDVVELLMTLEEQFNLTVPDEIASELKTVGSLVSYIEKNAKKH